MMMPKRTCPPEMMIAPIIRNPAAPFEVMGAAGPGRAGGSADWFSLVRVSPPAAVRDYMKAGTTRVVESGPSRSSPGSPATPATATPATAGEATAATAPRRWW